MWRKIDRLTAIALPIILSGIAIPLLWQMGEQVVQKVDIFLIQDWDVPRRTWYLNHASFALSIGLIPAISLLIPLLFRRINTILVLSNIIFSYGIQVLTVFLALNYFTEDNGVYRKMDLPNEWIWNHVLILSAVIPTSLLLIGYSVIFYRKKQDSQIIDN